MLLLTVLSLAGSSSGVCDIYKTAGTPCVAAHSMTRALYSAYAGPLYLVERASDKKQFAVKVRILSPLMLRRKIPFVLTCTLSVTLL